VAPKENQTAIYYLGDDVARPRNPPHIEGFRARGVEEPTSRRQLW
jgi:molecular chaperone HtpG